MAKPPKTPHFMRDIRAALEWTQADLARMLGVTASAIKRIELGKLQMSPNFQHKLYSETGIIRLTGWQWDGVTVFQHQGGKIGPYTKADHALWKARTSKSTKAERKALAESLHQWTEILFEAAYSQFTKDDKFLTVYQAVVEAIDQICRDYQLVEKAEKILAESWPLWQKHGLGIRKSKRGFWHPGFIAPQIKESIPSWIGSYTTLSDVSDPKTSGYPILSEEEAAKAVENVRQAVKTLKTLPSPPSTENARPANDRRSASRARRRRGVPASAKP